MQRSESLLLVDEKGKAMRNTARSEPDALATWSWTLEYFLLSSTQLPPDEFFHFSRTTPHPHRPSTQIKPFTNQVIFSQNLEHYPRCLSYWNPSSMPWSIHTLWPNEINSTTAPETHSQAQHSTISCIMFATQHGNLQLCLYRRHGLKLSRKHGLPGRSKHPSCRR